MLVILEHSRGQSVHSEGVDRLVDSSRVFEVIERIYDAAQDPTRWPSALGAISEAVGGESIALYAGFPDARTPDLYAFENVSPDVWHDFAEHYAAINPIMAACEAMFKPDVPWVSDLALPNSAFERTEFYNDFYRPNDMQYSLGLRLELPDLPSASLSCQREGTRLLRHTRDRSVSDTNTSSSTGIADS